MRKRFRLGTYIAIAAFGILDPVGADSWEHYPAQKPYQKAEEPEAGPEDDQPKGGYAAPPRSGTMAGPTSSVGLDGLELEIPALKLKLPKIRFPSLTRFQTPARMIVDEAIAPFVEEFRKEFSVEAGPETDRPEAGRESDGDPEAGAEDGAKPLQKPSQKTDISPSQVMYEQERLEQRVRELEELLASVEANVTSSRRREEPPTQERVPEISRTVPGTRAPEPLPAVSVTRPASYEVPVYPVARASFGTASPAPHPTANELQLAELRELVISLQQQQKELLGQVTRQQVSASHPAQPYEVSQNWRTGSGTGNQNQIPNRLPQVVR